MKIDKATVTRLLRKSPNTAERQDNLWAKVGSGKRKAIYFFFYWTEFGGRQYRKIGQANTDTPASTLKQLNAQYFQMLGQYQQGITPTMLERVDRKRDDALQTEARELLEVQSTRYGAGTSCSTARSVV